MALVLPKNPDPAWSNPSLDKGMEPAARHRELSGAWLSGVRVRFWSLAWLWLGNAFYFFFSDPTLVILTLQLLVRAGVEPGKAF